MRILTLLSVATFTLLLTGDVKADLGLPMSHQECRSKASTKQAIERCDALKACVDHSSTDEGTLQDCTFKVETDYLAAIGVPSEDAASANSVIDPSKADYYDIDGHKGWENANQGGN